MNWINFFSISVSNIRPSGHERGKNISWVVLISVLIRTRVMAISRSLKEWSETRHLLMLRRESWLRSWKTSGPKSYPRPAWKGCSRSIMKIGVIIMGLIEYLTSHKMFLSDRDIEKIIKSGEITLKPFDVHKLQIGR